MQKRARIAARRAERKWFSYLILFVGGDADGAILAAVRRGLCAYATVVVVVVMVTRRCSDGTSHCEYTYNQVYKRVLTLLTRRTAYR